MAKTREVPTEPLPPLPEGYDPARRDHIHELVERLRATDNPQEIERLENELCDFIFGPVNAGD